MREAENWHIYGEGDEVPDRPVVGQVWRRRRPSASGEDDAFAILGVAGRRRGPWRVIVASPLNGFVTYDNKMSVWKEYEVVPQEELDAYVARKGAAERAEVEKLLTG